MSEQERNQQESSPEAVEPETGADQESASSAATSPASDAWQNGQIAESATADSEDKNDGREDDEAVENVIAEESTLDDPQEIIAQLEAELVEATTKAEHYLDQMQRTAAEFQNVRRRQERQLEQSIERATEGIIRRLLPILDDFELAFNNMPDSLREEEEAWSEGFSRIHHKLLSLLEEEGVTAIEPEGEFDPNRHEAITNEQNDEVESGHIIETLRTGYEYKDRVLRPALVRVAE